MLTSEWVFIVIVLDERRHPAALRVHREAARQVEETGGFWKIQGGSGLRIFLIGNPTSDTCTTGKRRGVVKKAAWGGGGDEDPGQVSRSIAVRLNIFAAFSFCCCFPAVDHIHSADYIDEGQLVAWDRSLPPIELEEQKKEAFELKGEGNALYLQGKYEDEEACAKYTAGLRVCPLSASKDR